MWPQQVALSYFQTWGIAERTGHDKKTKKVPFDPKVFLATVNGGWSISKYGEAASVDGLKATVIS